MLMNVYREHLVTNAGRKRMTWRPFVGLVPVLVSEDRWVPSSYNLWIHWEGHNWPFAVKPLWNYSRLFVVIHVHYNVLGCDASSLFGGNHATRYDCSCIFYQDENKVSELWCMVECPIHIYRDWCLFSLIFNLNEYQVQRVQLDTLCLA